MTDVRRETIPLLWSAVRERASAKGFIFNMGIRSILVAAEEQSWPETQGGQRDRQKMG